MTRDEILNKILDIMKKDFEIENPELDVNLNEKYGFDSIDAIELLEYIEEIIGSPLTHDEKKKAMDIRNINNICDYVFEISKNRGL
jgi:acyl carrier protein